MASRNEATGDVLANVKGSADAYADGWDRIFGKKQTEVQSDGQPVMIGKCTFLSENDPQRKEVGVFASEFCHKCGGAMLPGKAIAQTLVGSPDFPGDTRGVTMSPGGPGKLIDCLKCEDCGWSTS